MAQLLKLGSDDSDSTFSPFETQFRRRIWWTLCWLEKRCAEDIAEPTSIMTWGSACSLPIKICDNDLCSRGSLPVPRVGLADNTFCLMRFEVLKLFFKLHRMKPDPTIRDERQRQENLVHLKEVLLNETKARLEEDVLQYCSDTRPFDWLVMHFVQAVMVSTGLCLNVCLIRINR